MEIAPPRRSVYAPTAHINFLPAEILQQIFLTCLWTPHPSHLSDSPIDVSQLALTCKRWYNLVFGFPAIWSHFVMDFGPHSWPIPGWDRMGDLEFPMHKLYRDVEVFFDKPFSGDVSVARSLALKMPYNMQENRYSGEYDEFCEFFDGQGRLDKDTAATIREAEFRLDPEIALSVFYALKRGGPTETTTWSQLTTLNMTATWGWPMGHEVMDIIVAEGKLVSFMPHLVHLTLKVHDVQVWKKAIPWGQLLMLELHTVYSYPCDLLEIVHKCSKLQRLQLQIGYRWGGRTEPNPKCVTFPALENLHLSFDLPEDVELDDPLATPRCMIEYFLQGISAPNLEGLHLLCIRDKIYVREAVFRSFIDRCRGLKSLYLGLVSFIHDLPLPACQQLLHEKTIESFITVLAGLPRSLVLLGLMYYHDDPRVPPEFYWLDKKQNECGTFLPNVRAFYLNVVEEKDDAPGVIDGMVEEIGQQAFFRARSEHTVLGHADPEFNGGVEGVEPCRCARIPSWVVRKVQLERETIDWFFGAFEYRRLDEESHDIDTYYFSSSSHSQHLR